jgi:hypothetical protein
MRARSTLRGSVAVTIGACALIVSMPMAAVAQPPAGANDELIQAILRYTFHYRGGNVRLVPGGVPDDLAPNFHAPPGTRVLGTVVWTSGALVLATTPGSADSIRVEYTRALAPRAWKPWESLGQARGGFVGSTSERPFVLCHERAQLQIAHRRRATPPHDLALEYTEGGGMCDRPSGPPSPRYVAMDEPRFPTLRSPDPPPARPTQTCYPRTGRRSASAMSTGTVVSTDLRAAELLRHYGGQLEAAGWSAPGRSGTSEAASATWARTDSTGVSQVTLDVIETTGGSGCYEVQMRITVPR